MEQLNHAVAVMEQLNPTPLLPLPRLSDKLGIDLWVKRDDLLPLPGGGNKVRKIHTIMRDAIARQSTVLVTNGGMQSNHARVVALVAAARGLGCRLVLHDATGDRSSWSGNFRLMQLAGADICIVPPDGVADALKRTLETLRRQGEIPFEIPGGGHSLAGTTAYADAVGELRRQITNRDWSPDTIVVASGTGATQAGLVAGTICHRVHAQVIGISVARRNPYGAQVVQRSLNEYLTHVGLPTPDDVVHFRDEWIGDGYERANAEVWAALTLAARSEGLVLDPTYTGKAFAGLLHLVRTGEIPTGARVLFWHTGGLLNLMAAQDCAFGGSES
jgi:1-aminocyclopropane-1-carboxylate deaminase/D-cysteine desulfhydrase-like pyridoxal-dependent ACC family enzyme